ncbi:uncharacterized protein BX664DRAFT_374094 [Halteromyces radiatus]|uniref:uncharacterized protein n=1 Tax=Halteromyces radiatus TaxID=101107 RepID=UPI002220B27C|nr:uncharacterized protein BX664DRAFT_374094 [Halteromyces radiatus]KAI8090044.1 hypothetical protein BX664DRAFT_374094 [Halteromyces radiatus]
MRFFKCERRYSSITVAIDRLSNLHEMEWFTLQHLMESIAIQDQGPKEAVEVIQKRLKKGTCQQQLRLLEVLNYLVERSHLRVLHQVIVTSKLKSRLKWIMKSKTDVKVKAKLLVMLETWVEQYKQDEPKIDKFSSAILGRNQVQEKIWLYAQQNGFNQHDLSTNDQGKQTEKSLMDLSPHFLYGFPLFSRRYHHLSSSRHSYIL